MKGKGGRIMNGRQKKNYNRTVKIIASLLILLCLVLIGIVINSASEQSFVMVFVVPLVIAIVIIFFTAKDMLK